ncbi:MAG: hypothetical protein AB2L14_35915 [Candidatus Xenobiia bacterium LiM19]
MEESDSQEKVIVRDSSLSREIWIYRLYDCAEEFDLNKVEETLSRKMPIKRLRLSRIKSTSIIMEHPPVSAEMGPLEIKAAQRALSGSLLAKFYRLGIVNLIMRLTIPEDISFEELRSLVADLSTSSLVADMSLSYFNGIKKTLEGTFVPSTRMGFTEDYTLFFLRTWPKDWDPVPLLLAERDELSEQSREEALKNSFSYGKKDRTIITWDAAIVVDDTGSSDIPDIIEFALTQLLLLRYYDSIVTDELEKMRIHVGKAATFGFYSRLKRYRQITKKLMQIVLEVTEVVEKVQNSLKVTEDIFYARLHRAAQNVFATDGWQRSIERKITVIQETYHILKSEIETQNSFILEITIVVLIFIEIVLGIFKML